MRSIRAAGSEMLRPSMLAWIQPPAARGRVTRRYAFRISDSWSSTAMRETRSLAFSTARS